MENNTAYVLTNKAVRQLGMTYQAHTQFSYCVKRKINKRLHNRKCKREGGKQNPISLETGDMLIVIMGKQSSPALESLSAVQCCK